MALNFLPQVPCELKPRITVIGVGGAGGNAVNNMISSRLEGVEFICANTDAQALSLVQTENRIQLGLATTQGLGAGSRPDVGRVAAEESLDELTEMLAGANMVFITAGMGGGTGTGAAPVIAQAARDRGILTVGVVTKPFHFEGPHRMRTAEAGIETLSKIVDTLIIIPNQNLFRIATERTTFAEAFKMADDVLYSGVRGVTDLMVMPGLINLDFADIRCVMSEMGKAMMGTGEAEGTDRSLKAAEAAISNPLLDDTSMKGAKGVLINITGGLDMTLFEADAAANRIREEVDSDANIIFGSTFDEKLNGKIRVSVVATGIESEIVQRAQPSVVTLPTAATQIKTQAPATSGPTPSGHTPSGHTPHGPNSSAYSASGPQTVLRPATMGPATIGNVALAQQPAPSVARAAPAVARAQPSIAAEQARQPQLDMPAPLQAPLQAPAQPQIQALLDPRPDLLRAEPSFEPSFDPLGQSRPVIEPRADHRYGQTPDDRTNPSMENLSRAIEGIASHGQGRDRDHHTSEPHHTPHPAPAEDTARTPSLFNRLIRGTRAPVAQAQQPQPQQQPTQNRPAAEHQQPRLSGLETRREPVVSTQGDDLNIPAFLRRQNH